MKIEAAFRDRFSALIRCVTGDAVNHFESERCFQSNCVEGPEGKISVECSTTNRIEKKYFQVMIEPAYISDEDDAAFEDISVDDRAALASDMMMAFCESLGRNFDISNYAAPGIFRVRLMLLGAKKTRSLISLLLHFSVVGNVYNVIRAVQREPGAFSGTVSYQVQVFEGSSERIVHEYRMT